jgi:hypothetical protein
MLIQAGDEMVDGVRDYDGGLFCNERKRDETKRKETFVDKDVVIVKAEELSGSEQRGSGVPTSGPKMGRN